MDAITEECLPRATAEKVELYKKCLAGDSNVPFWDIVVLTAGNETQKQSFEEQLERKKKRKEIPSSVKYMVFSDPPGAKIGAGGATMYVLQQMEQLLGWGELSKAKVFLLHAGGYSQRLPIVSAVGKAFMAIPCGDPVFYQTLDINMIMYCDLPARMNPGVFLAASDIFFLYNSTGDWNMHGPGIVGIAHPAPVQFCTNHGVFLLKDIDKVWKKYEQDPSNPAIMADVERFLHKSSVSTIKDNGALISGQEKIYVDLAYWFDYEVAKKMIKFYSENEPLGCEIDAYGDFLQALGPAGTPDYCERTGHVSTATDSLVEMRRKIYDMLRDTQFKAVVFNQAQFNHVGTTKEYSHHMCYNTTLRQSFQFRPETAVRFLSSADDADSPNKKRKTEDQNYAIICSQLSDRESVSIGAGSVVEYCIIGQEVTIGSDSIVSGLNIPPQSVVPDSSFLHTLPVTIDKRIYYVTFVFDISDSMKGSCETPLDLPYCKLKLGDALKQLFPDNPRLDNIWPSDAPTNTLWNARLFPAFPSRQLSSQCAVEMINCLRDPSKKLTMHIDGMRFMSVLEMVQSHSLQALLSYCNEIQDLNV